MNYRAKLIENKDFLGLHASSPESFPFLLESVAGHSATGRFDVLAALPGERLEGGDLFLRLSSLAQSERIAAQSELPFLGGWFLLIGYEAARHIEPTLSFPASPFQLPDCVALRCRGALIHDQSTRQTFAVAETDDGLAQLLSAIALAEPGRFQDAWRPADEITEESPAKFIDGVEQVLDYLKQGDAFQVNLSRVWTARYAREVNAPTLYRRLRETNPAPFAGSARIGDSWVLSSSPERLVEVEGDRVQTRPIAGTRPRVQGHEDAHLQSQLIGSLKERAEHVMLIDLERNDLGRICRPGSIEVSELMSLESYAHVHHIVSNVRGTLRPEVGPGEVLRAVFPGGTITGCPKVRAMEIIAELEGTGRGAYTGSMGYLSRCGRMDTNILIRTLVVEGSTVTLRAGAGIVADSAPLHELAETRAKARGLLMALEREPSP